MERANGPSGRRLSGASACSGAGPPAAVHCAFHARHALHSVKVVGVCRHPRRNRERGAGACRRTRRGVEPVPPPLRVAVESLERPHRFVHSGRRLQNEAIAERLHCSGVEFTISVPFERFAALKGLVEGRRRWRRMAPGLDSFETRWKPKPWNTRYRSIFNQKAGRMPDDAPAGNHGNNNKRLRTRQRTSGTAFRRHRRRRRGRGAREPGRVPRRRGRCGPAVRR